jgi:mannosyltransferase
MKSGVSGAIGAWRSPRLLALILLTVTLGIGAHLRFHRLVKMDMSPDEGASWAAAVLPDVHSIVEAERHLDPGKLALYDLLLHEWIQIFGDGLFSMRAMSAALGTINILLVFAAVREVYRRLSVDADVATAELTGGFAALLYAVNVTMVLSDRTARMYSLVIVAELLQILFLTRSYSSGGVYNYAGTAISTAAMIAANFTAAFLLIAEGIWLGCLLLEEIVETRRVGGAIIRSVFALALGMALLGPLLPSAVSTSSHAVGKGVIDWIKPQPISWPFTTLREAGGSDVLFWFLVALGVLGALRHWRRSGPALGFFSAWTLGPFVAVMAVTYLVHPLEFRRYVIIALVGLFAFAGLGAASLPSLELGFFARLGVGSQETFEQPVTVALRVRRNWLRVAVAILLIWLSVGPVRERIRNDPYAAEWKAATKDVASRTRSNDLIAVFPPYAVNVVRYYLPPERRESAVGMKQECLSAPLFLIMSGRDIALPQRIAIAERCYPRVLMRAHLIEERER